MASVSLCSVSKAFGQNIVLQDIDLTVKDQEFMVLVGPSGCGKSTLLRLIAGLENITSGEIYLGDRQIDDLPPKARDIAMVFQSYALYPHMSVYDNIAFGLRRQQPSNIFSSGFNKRKTAINTKVLQVAKSLQIETLLQRKPKELSGGQKQRVALGRAIARNPQVFLMDEPLSNLDAQLRSETRSQIVQLQSSLQTTTIYVTHDQVEAMTMGTRIAVLKSGRIQQVDTPLNLYCQPVNRFVAGFIGSPPMNFLSVQFSDGYLYGSALHQSIALSKSQTEQLGSASSFILGIRPEHLRLADHNTGNLCGTVQLIEALGAETNVIMQIEQQSVQAKVNAEGHFTIGERLFWSVNPDKLYLFSAESELALLHPKF